MNEEKQMKTLTGALLRPLTVGTRAVILHRGLVTLTSQVEAIHKRTEEEICFETRNSLYRVLTGPVRSPAVSLSPMLLAA